MKGAEFLEMMKQDIATDTASEHNLNAVVECMAAVIAMHPNCDIHDDSKKPKTPQGCYKFLEDTARQNKNGNAYFMSPNEALNLTARYLGLAENASDAVQSSIPKAKVRTVSLEEFF